MFNYNGQIVVFDEVKDITSKEYFSKEEYSADMFNTKYCKSFDKEGKIVESHDSTAITLETPAQVFMRVSSQLAEYEPDEKIKKELIDVWFTLMWQGWFRPGGSVLSGVGSCKKISLNNCTTIPLYEDSLESIAQTRLWLKKAAAYRQGAGFDGSVLRPRGSKVNNAAEESTGTIPWIDDLVRIGGKVGQRGRLPALLVSLKISHPDIEEFIVCKDDLTQITNANISVQITNAFMKAVFNDKIWETRFEVEATGEVISKKVKAKELFKKIAEHAHKAGEPGVQYIDLLRKGSMVQVVYTVTGDVKYKIISTNACSEKPLAAHSVCNLLSNNMEMFSTDPKQYMKELEMIVPYCVMMSDNVINYELDKNISPIKEQKEMVKNLREIGLGITNVHGWLLKQDLAYDSNKAIEVVEEFMKYYAYIVFKTSMWLGKQYGNAPAFDLVEDKSAFMESIYFKNIVNEFFDGDSSKIINMRNMAHMSIAPAGSLSGTFPSPCISSGIEPVVGVYYWRRTRAIEKGVYTHYFVIPPRLKEYILSKMEEGSEDYKTLSAFTGSERDEDGNIGNELIEIINKHMPKGFFKPAHELNPLKKVKLMGAVYKWIDAAVSCTYNLSADSTAKDVENIYFEAYRQGVRAVTVYVDGSREGILIFEDPITNKAKFEGSLEGSLCAERRPETIIPVCAPKRPAELECNVHHCSVKGTPWLVIVGMLGDNPYEVFAGEAEDLYLPKSCKAGKIIKQGNGKYSLEVVIRRTEVEYKDLAHILMSCEQRAVTRLVSLAMRHGTPLEFIQEQMRKTNGEITDFSTVIARVLSTYIKQYVYTKQIQECPVCKESSMVRVEGCMKCVNPKCNYSRCE